MKTFFAFSNVTSQDEAELSIYDEIGFWGTQAKDFYASLKSITAKKIKLRINSPGGSVVDGYAIHNLLRAHAAEVEVHIDGIAASIASFIAMAGDKIIMPQNALMFLHSPLVNGASGNAEELRQIAAELDKVQKGIVSGYMRKTGKDEATVVSWLEAETLFTAEEAFEAGLATEIVDKVKMSACYKPGDYFKNQKLLETFPTNAPANGGATETENNMSKDLLDKIAAHEATIAGHATALKNAADKAVADAKTAEAARRKDILALRDKYNKDGDLNDIAVVALSDETSATDFKDQILEAINKRSAQPVAKDAIKPGAGGANDSDDLLTRYKATKPGSAERRKLVRENKSEIRALARSGAVDE